MKLLASIILTAALSMPTPVYADGKADLLAAPAVLARIRWCESRGSYTAANRHSTASGAYQLLDSTHRAWARAFGRDIGADRYRRSRQAPAWVQDVLAARALQRFGTAPWRSSRRCWR